VHQLTAQITAYKRIALGQSLSNDLTVHIQRLSPSQWTSVEHTQLSRLSAIKAAQVQEELELTRRRVPGALKAHPTPYYAEVRALVLPKDTWESLLTDLADIQSEVRSQVLAEYRGRVECMRDSSHRALEVTLLDREFYRRTSTPSALKNKQEQRVLKNFEQAMRNGQELKKKNKHNEFLAELLNFHRDFFENQRKKYHALRRTAKDVKTFIDSLDRRKQVEYDKEQKERMAALKVNDLDTYIDLINKTKNERILEILRQTDSYLRQLGAKVKVQKGEEAADEERDFAGEGEGVTDSYKQSQSMYLNLTHAVAEEIKGQPRGLEGGTLKNYQIQGLQWLVSLYNNQLHGVLADEMGLGKTIQTIALFQYIIEEKKNLGPFLVVAPLSTISNWVMEFSRWAPGIAKVIYKGTPIERKKLIQNALHSRSFNVLLTTYEYIIKDKQLLSKVHWSYIVVDEGHRMKNSKSKFASVLGFQYQSDHRLLLTGTPLQNNLAELWSLLNFLLPKIFNSQEDFEKWFNQPFSKISDKQQMELNEEESLLLINRMHQVLRPFLLRRVKKEVETELPDKVENVIKVEMSSWQTTLYEHIKEKGLHPSSKIQSLNNTVMQLRKVCNHPYLFVRDSASCPVTDEIWRCSGKFELLERILPKFIASKHKVLIFCQMTKLMDIMQVYFDYRGYRYLRLDGTTKVDDRDIRMEMFNSATSEYSIFILSTRAGGLGLNLQAADTVIIFDSDWNPQMDLQAQDRAHRIGQRHEVRVYRLVTNTRIEEEILIRAGQKKLLDVQVIQAGLFNNKSTDHDRREKLKAILHQEEEEDFGDRVFTDEQINNILARNEAEFELFEAMDAERYRHERCSRLIEPSEELPAWLKSAVRAR
jgi:ATP-dependent helicase STH1/SNF2